MAGICWTLLQGTFPGDWDYSDRVVSGIEFSYRHTLAMGWRINVFPYCEGIRSDAAQLPGPGQWGGNAAAVPQPSPRRPRPVPFVRFAAVAPISGSVSRGES